MYRSREWLYERIRRGRRQSPEISGRALAQKYRVSRDTVARALRRPVPLTRQQRLVRAARFPSPKRLEDFCFEKNPNVAPEAIGVLRNPAWVSEGRLRVLIGDSGTGKSHLLVGVGTAIAEAGLTVRCTTTSTLVSELAARRS